MTEKVKKRVISKSKLSGGIRVRKNLLKGGESPEKKKCDSEPFKISVTDCDGIVDAEAEIYDCIHANDIVPIATVLLDKLGWILWPRICDDNHFVIKWIINGLDMGWHIPWTDIPFPDSPVHLVLFFIYYHLLKDLYYDYVKPQICEAFEKYSSEVDDPSWFMEYVVIPFVKNWIFSCGEDDPDEQSWGEDLIGENSWWEYSPHAGPLSAGDSCQAKFYNKGGHATDYTLWKNEKKTPNNNTSQHNPGDIDKLCRNFTQCTDTWQFWGHDEENSPRKYKECCDLTFDYYGKTDGNSQFPSSRTPSISGEGAFCDGDEFIQGLSCDEVEANEAAHYECCNAIGGSDYDDFPAGGGARPWWENSCFNPLCPNRSSKERRTQCKCVAGNHDDKTSWPPGEPGNKIASDGSVADHMCHPNEGAVDENRKCRQEEIDKSCGGGGTSNTDAYWVKDEAGPNTYRRITNISNAESGKTGPRARHAHNALVRFKRNKDISLCTDLTTNGEKLEPEETIDGSGRDYTKGCHPALDPKYGYLGKDYCEGNFKKTTLKREFIQSVKNWWKSTFYSKIKTLYKIILVLYILLWIIIKTGQSRTLQIILVIVILIYIYFKIQGWCKIHERDPDSPWICMNKNSTDEPDKVVNIHGPAFAVESRGECDPTSLPDECKKDGEGGDECKNFAKVDNKGDIILKEDMESIDAAARQSQSLQDTAFSDSAWSTYSHGLF